MDENTPMMEEILGKVVATVNGKNIITITDGDYIDITTEETPEGVVLTISNKPQEVSYTALEAEMGVILEGNQKVIFTEPLNTLNITSASGTGYMIFVAGNTIFSLPSGFGWIGGTPIFTNNRVYIVTWVDGMMIASLPKEDEVI